MDCITTGFTRVTEAALLLTDRQRHILALIGQMSEIHIMFFPHVYRTLMQYDTHTIWANVYTLHQIIIIIIINYMF